MRKTTVRYSTSFATVGEVNPTGMWRIYNKDTIQIQVLYKYKHWSNKSKRIIPWLSWPRHLVYEEELLESKEWISENNIRFTEYEEFDCNEK